MDDVEEEHSDNDDTNTLFLLNDECFNNEND